jgi:DNA-binding MarR family transcriptional regulator
MDIAGKTRFHGGPFLRAAIQPHCEAIVKIVGYQTNWPDAGNRTVRGKQLGKRVRSENRIRNGNLNGGVIDYGRLAGWVGFNLRMAQEASFEAFSRRSREVGESPGRFATLTIISRNPGISQTALSQASGRDKSSVTPVIEDLVRRGLVARKRVPSDRRVWRLSLTPSGKRTLDTLMRCARVHDRNLDRIVGPRDRPRFLAMLKKIAAKIE